MANVAAALVWQHLTRLACGHGHAGETGPSQTVSQTSLLTAETDRSNIHRGDESGGGDDHLAVEIFQASHLEAEGEHGGRDGDASRGCGQIDGPSAGPEIEALVLYAERVAELALEGRAGENVFWSGRCERGPDGLRVGEVEGYKRFGEALMPASSRCRS